MLFLRCQPNKCFPRKIIHSCFLLYIYHDREREEKRRKYLHSSRFVTTSHVCGYLPPWCFGLTAAYT